MEAITLRQLLNTYNFRLYNDSQILESDKYDTQIIRIYPKEDNYSIFWFEFGLYSFGGKLSDIYENILNKDILELNVCNIEVKNDTLYVYLTKQTKIDLS